MFNSLFSNNTDEYAEFHGIKMPAYILAEKLVELCLERAKNKLKLLSQILSNNGLIIDNSEMVGKLFKRSFENEVLIVLSHISNNIPPQSRASIKSKFTQKVSTYINQSPALTHYFLTSDIQFIDGKYLLEGDFFFNQCLIDCGFTSEDIPVFTQRGIGEELKTIDQNFQLSLIDAKIN